MSSRVDMKKAARDERLAHEHERELAGRRRKRLLVVGGAFAAVLLVAAVVAIAIGGGSSSDKKPGAAAGGAEVAALYAGIPQQGTRLGSRKAPVTLTEYADLQCPFCAEYARRALPTIVKRYVRTGKVRLDFRVLTFLGPDSERAGRMALAAGDQNRLWQFIELFYENQGQENTGYATDAFLRKIGAAIPGLDVDRALRGRDAPRTTVELAKAREQAARYGIDSTPTFQIAKRGGAPRPLDVASLDASAFTSQLDRELAGR